MSDNEIAPPSEEPGNCGNCWQPLGTTPWCPTCQIESEYTTHD